MTLDSTLEKNTINLHFGSPRVWLASSLLFEVVEFGQNLGTQAQESVALITERMGGGVIDFSRGYVVTELAPVYQEQQLVLNLNVDAPIVFIPSRVDVKEGPTIVVDLGRVVIFHDSGPVDPAPEFFDYNIDMRDLNAYITEGDSCDPVGYEDRAIIKKFDMHFNLRARNSQNLAHPATKLHGKLPKMNIFVTKQKIRDILIVANSIKPEAFVSAEAIEPEPADPTAKSSLASQQGPLLQREWLLDSFFEVDALNVMLRDTAQSSSDRGAALVRVCLNGLRVKFDLSNQDMKLDTKLDRLRLKDRTPANKSTIAKNLVASPKGTSLSRLPSLPSLLSPPLLETFSPLPSSKP
jgi:hypothetical protein